MKTRKENEDKYTKTQKNAIFTAVLTAFITTFMGSALNLSIPALGAEFQASAQSVGWVVTVYMLTCSALTVIFGRLADIYDRKTILCTGILVFAAASAFSVLSQEMWMLLALRFLQGVGASMIFATNLAILMAAFDTDKRGRVLGYATCATYAGLSMGPVIGGVLNEHFGWRAVFLVTAAVSASAFFTAAFKIPGKSKFGKAREIFQAFDLRGSILFILSVSLFMYGLSSVKSMDAALYIMAAGIPAFFLFLRTERKAENPVVNIKLFSENLSYTMNNLAALLNYGAIFAVTYLLSVYLQVIKGISSQSAGIILITSAVMMAVFSPIFGRLSDRRSPFLLSAFGMGICAAALGMFAFMTREADLPFILTALALSGFGFSVFSSPNTNAVMSFVEPDDYSAASSALAAMRSLGHTTGMAVVTLVTGIFVGEKTLTDAEPALLMKAVRICFFTFSFFCILGIFMARKRKM